MEILFVSHKYPPSTGGMQKQSFELINGLKKYAKVHQIVYDGRKTKLWFFITLRKKVRRACKLHPGISIIHYNDGLIAAFAPTFGIKSSIKQVVTLHGLDVVFSNQMYQRRLLSVFNQFHLCITVSKATAVEALQRGLSPKKIVTIQNGVDVSIKPMPVDSTFCKAISSDFNIHLKNKKLVVALGRSVTRKGFSWFIENVYPRLIPGVIFVIIGPFSRHRTLIEKVLGMLPDNWSIQIERMTGFPADEKVIRQLLEGPRYQQGVYHVGKQTFPQIKQWLSAADVFVMPNIKVEGDMEGFGLVCLEAGLCGTTVFAADLEGIKDAIIPHKNGYLLPSADAIEWANTLNQFLQSKADDSFVKKSIDFTASNFDWDIMAKRYFAAFKALDEQY